MSSERPHRTHIIFLTWRLTKTLQKPFLQNFHVVIKIHLSPPLEYEVMVSSIKRETTSLLHYTGKNKLKVFTWKTITPPFSKILLSSHASLCCDVTLARHIGQPRSRVYDSLLSRGEKKTKKQKTRESSNR